MVYSRSAVVPPLYSMPVAVSYQSFPAGNHMLRGARPVTLSTGVQTVVARMSSPKKNSSFQL